MMVLAQVGTVKELSEAFGGGPIAAAFACLLLAIVALFWMLIRAKNESRDLATAVLPRLDKMAETINSMFKAVEVLQDTNVLLRHVLETKAPNRRKTQPPPPGPNVVASGDKAA